LSGPVALVAKNARRQMGYGPPNEQARHAKPCSALILSAIEKHTREI